jgi:sec-independent protein translocase protein TatC
MATEPSILTSGLFATAEHIRRAVFRVVFVLLGGTLVAYPFAKYLLHFLKQPLGSPLVIYAPLEGLLGYIKVSMAAGFLLTSPLLLYEVNRFLQRVCRMSPSVAIGATIATAGLFLLGVTFCYVAILPVTLGFLLSFGGENIAAGISVSRYLSLTLGLSATCGAIFELPLVVVILHRLGLISIAFLTQNRRYAILIAAVTTAIITPTPDAFTMTLLLVPLLGLYEGSILLLRLIERRASAQANDR